MTIYFATAHANTFYTLYHNEQLPLLMSLNKYKYVSGWQTLSLDQLEICEKVRPWAFYVLVLNPKISTGYNTRLHPEATRQYFFIIIASFFHQLQWRIQSTVQLLDSPSPHQFLNILWKWNNLVSVRPNYFIFMEYLRKKRWNQQSEPSHLYIYEPLSRNPGSAPELDS